jgi:hypothetical protein
MPLTTIIDANVVGQPDQRAGPGDRQRAARPQHPESRCRPAPRPGRPTCAGPTTAPSRPSSTDALDLAGALVGNLGGTLTIVKLKAVLVRAAAANANNVRINRPASNGVPLFIAASDGIDVLPGGLFLWVAPGAGVTVTAATGDLLNIDNSGSGTSVTYDVVLVGTSA